MEMQEGWLGSHGQQLNFWRYISVGGVVPLRNVGSKSQDGLASLQQESQNGTQITSSCEKQQGFCLPVRVGWRCREPPKGPMHKISLEATYPRLWQREGRVD